MDNDVKFTQEELNLIYIFVKRGIEFAPDENTDDENILAESIINKIKKIE